MTLPLRTNYVANPRLKDSNADGTPDLFTFVKTVAGTPTPTIIDRGGGRYAVRIQYTGLAGDDGTKMIMLSCDSAAGAFAPADPASVQAVISGSQSGVTTQLLGYTVRADGTTVVDTFGTAALTPSATPTRVTVALASAAALTSILRLRFAHFSVGTGDVIDVTWELPGIEKAAAAGAYFDGNLVRAGFAYRWATSVDASVSQERHAVPVFPRRIPSLRSFGASG